MITPDEKVRRAIESLESNSNFKLILEWVEKSALHHAAISARLKGEESHWEQGKFQGLEELSKHLLLRDQLNGKREYVCQGASLV